MNLFRNYRRNELPAHGEDLLLPSPSSESYEYKYDYPDYTIGDHQLKGIMMTHSIMALVLPILIAILGFILFVVIIAKKHLRHSPTCWLVLNVLAGIMIKGLVVMPTEEINSMEWISGDIFCKIYIGLSNLTVVHIQMSLLVLLINRFIYFVRPQSVQTQKAESLIARCLIGCSLAVEFVIITASFIMLKAGTKGDYVQYCRRSGKHLLADLVLTLVTPTLLNMLFGLIILGCIPMVYCRLSGSTEDKSHRRQAFAMSIMMFLSLVGLHFPLVMAALSTMIFHQPVRADIWYLFKVLNGIFHLVTLIIFMIFIPDIRRAICCKTVKKGEAMPLVNKTDKTDKSDAD